MGLFVHIKQMMALLIVDSSVFVCGYRIGSAEALTVPGVMRELKDVRSITLFEQARSTGLKVEPAEQRYIDEVVKTARRTGDVGVLSETDIHLLAKALQYIGKGACIITDDYAIQNVASRLGIQIKPIMQHKIRDVLIWKKRCIGCGRYFAQGDICSVCGSKLKRTRRKE